MYNGRNEGLLAGIAFDLAIDENLLRKELASSRRRVKIAKLPKRDGTYRRLHIAPRSFKLVQYIIMQSILAHIPVHRAAAAYFKGASILRNAKAHRSNNYFFRLDIESFFPSIMKSDVERALHEHTNVGGVNALLSAFERDEDLVYSLFVDGEKCGTGYPITPLLSNIVMAKIDHEIDAWLVSKKKDFGSPIYTRYADDIVISIKKKGHADEIIRVVSAIIEESESPRLRVNRRKIALGNKRAGSAQVTGLRITPDSRITLHRQYKDRVRLLVSLAENDQLVPSERASLRGHLNHARNADPAFFGKLRTRYFDTVNAILSWR